MTFKPIILLSILILLLVNCIFGQVISNQGKEFWAVFPSHVPDAPDGNPVLANISVFITSPQASSGKVSVGSFSANFTVTPNTVTEIKIPRAVAYIDTTEGGRPLSEKSIHILVDPGQPKVVVYAHIFAGRRSAASLILPVESLGKSYYSMNYMQDETNDGKNYIIVIATSDNTSVRLKKGNKELVPGGITLNKAGDVYEYLSRDDLTGVFITSATTECSSFAVFTGSSGARVIPPDCGIATSIDPLYQQAYPTQSWGLNYAYVPFSMQSIFRPDSVRKNGQFVRILAKDDGTAVSIDGVTVATLNAGQYFTTPKPLNKAAFITGSKPVCVAQYALSQLCAGNGNSYSDPEMLLLNPIEYSLKDITVYSSPFEKIKEQYINIVIKTSGINSFKINDAAPPSPFLPMETLPGYSYLQLNLSTYSTNNFHLSSSESFNATAYGFGDVESYAYSAGTNLFASYAISGIKQSTNQQIDSACVQDDYFFKLTLPFKSTGITWQLDANETPVLQANPTFNISLVNGISFYEYTFPKTPAYAQAGKHDIKIYANYPASECSSAGQLEINSTFAVIAPPPADFVIIAEGCNNSFKFEVQTTGALTNGTATWDFGDGTIITGVPLSTTPTHVYSLAKDYQVQLILSYGCATSVQKTLHVSQSELPAFEASPINCVEKPITFTDKSSFTDFKPVLWEWQFGDGQIITTTNNMPVDHSYNSPGNYPVKLILKNATGCSLEVKNTVKVNISPLPDFLAPQSCPGVAIQFANLTAEEPLLQFSWNFGDSNATQDNANTSTLKQPAHIYTAAGAYTVTLTTKSTNGCEQTVSKTIQVTQINITPQFEIQSELCNGSIINFKNTSITNGQTISSIEWYFDYEGHPDRKEPYSSPLTGAQYPHIYPALPPNVTQLTYKVKLVVYIEGGCSREIIKDVLLTTAPQLNFDELATVCSTTPAFQLTQAREITGVAGVGNYTGSGITADGLFNPEVAGTGTHNIQYSFTTISGCTAIATQSITVLAPPKITLPSLVTLEKNESLILQPAVEGDNLTFIWSPSTGLSSYTNANPIATPADNTTYVLTVSNGVCSTSASITINVVSPINIPNTFTPNGDGINDTWIIQNIEEHPDAIVDVFNRDGVNIFHSKGYATPWDGKYNSNGVPIGTYYYLITLNKSQKHITGSLTVIR